MNKRILLASSSGNLTSGASWSMLALAECLKQKGYSVAILIPKKGSLVQECRRRGMAFVLIRQTTNGWCESVAAKHDTAYRIKQLFRRGINLVAGLRIDRLMHRLKPDIVHVNALTCCLPARAALKNHIPLVWHMREFMEEDLNIRFVNRDRAFSMLDRATAVIAISQAVRDKFQGALSRPIQVIHNGIDVERFYCDREPFHNDVVEICMAGRIVREKGQEVLLRAAMGLIRKGYRIHTTFIGHVEDEAYCRGMQEAIDSAGLNGAFEFAGSTRNVEDYFRRADIVCVCSAMEAFGWVTVEGMLSGALVVGNDNGGTAEIITDGETGLLFSNMDPASLAEKLEYAIENTERARAIARRGRLHARDRFSAQTNADRIEKVYRQILNQHESGSRVFSDGKEC